MFTRSIKVLHNQNLADKNKATKGGFTNRLGGNAALFHES